MSIEGLTKFGEFELRRSAFRWYIVRNCSDGVVRQMNIGQFWRWIAAARIAQALWLVSIEDYHRSVQPTTREK